MKGVRADLRLVELGLCESREKARAVIMSGRAYLGETRVEKPGQNVPEDCLIELRGEENPFVSRGGLKLEKALSKYGVDLAGAVCADVGASTGGFTDCMLRRGAAKVYAIDVGYGQLDWKLRSDPRVAVMERTNARFMEPAWFAGPLDFASTDVSFISVRLILPGIYACLREGAQSVVLVKPQFEAGKGKVGKNGVVRDPALHVQVLCDAARFADSLGFASEAMDYSPIRGPKGNIEFLLLLRKSGAIDPDAAADIEARARRVVCEAHEAHNGA
ncbi:MAG: 16S/23S rRNA (cytidine-2'-O)-methyltransferase TlyA [Firmicutes bacterium ADurb.Bin248]|nr:MAG: 16S/23S rRNA (cytidine-2'-O)-methyltransferase TlyA [Firmicutes bacterium ADurb.Bin248]HOG00356.1 TlyA family RNA methyltransferase [Clostridia bacterium]HPK16245.1 TlyA family RNA methyltransferase [Clostridia bacterium]